MLWVLEVAFIFCVSGVGFWCEPLRVGFGGGVSCGGIHVCLRVFGGFTDFEEVELRDRRWSVARFVVGYCWCRCVSFSQSCCLFTDFATPSEDLHIRGEDSLRG
jgi:hypothetical protein